MAVPIGNDIQAMIDATIVHVRAHGVFLRSPYPATIFGTENKIVKITATKKAMATIPIINPGGGSFAFCGTCENTAPKMARYKIPIAATISMLKAV